MGGPTGIRAGAEPDMYAMRLLFVDWLSVPPTLRKPKLQKEMADLLGVTDQTLYNWKRDPRILSEVKAKIRSVLAVDDLSTIIDTLKEQAFDANNNRSVQAAKVLIEMINNVEVDVASVPLSDMSNDELKKMAANLYDEFDERTETG